jgi:hypothetical protein
LWVLVSRLTEGCPSWKLIQGPGLIDLVFAFHSYLPSFYDFHHHGTIRL